MVKVIGAILLAVLTLYAILAGADFGGGLWDLIAGGDITGRAPRRLIDDTVTPVWESNHVWLIFALVIFWTAFARAFAAVMTTCALPLWLAVLGIVLRGAGFAFRKEVQGVRWQRLLGAVFAFSSLLTPFFMGTVVGAVAAGRVALDAEHSTLTVWTSPTSILIGCLFVAVCAYQAAVFLISEAAKRTDRQLERYFRSPRRDRGHRRRSAVARHAARAATLRHPALPPTDGPSATPCRAGGRVRARSYRAAPGGSLARAPRRLGRGGGRRGMGLGRGSVPDASAAHRTHSFRWLRAPRHARHRLRGVRPRRRARDPQLPPALLAARSPVAGVRRTADRASMTSNTRLRLTAIRRGHERAPHNNLRSRRSVQPQLPRRLTLAEARGDRPDPLARSLPLLRGGALWCLFSWLDAGWDVLVPWRGDEFVAPVR